MPDFWEFPTVSMGLSPIMAIYQARFNRYLEDRALKPQTDAKVWAFIGDGKIIQELEAVFRGAGWNVIKVIWGSDWDPILERDTEGLLVRRMGEIVDGEYQKFVVEPGAYIRQHFFGSDPRLLKLVEEIPDEPLRT